MGHRVYEEIVSIDGNNTRKLYNERAARINKPEGISVNTSVLLGDQSPEYADLWDRTEKELILPYLDITDSSTIIDLGCGVGRWAHTLMPLCHGYIGVDFSDGMINAAEEYCKEYINEDRYFVVQAAQDYMFSHDKNKKTDCFIIAGVLMYINDSELPDMIKKIAQCASEHCTLFITDTVSLDKRITLQEIYSQALNNNYSALYRTVEEYEELFVILKSSGFECVSSGFFEKLNKEKEYSETDRYYRIFKR